MVPRIRTELINLSFYWSVKTGVSRAKCDIEFVITSPTDSNPAPELAPSIPWLRLPGIRTWWSIYGKHEFILHETTRSGKSMTIKVTWLRARRLSKGYHASHCTKWFYVQVLSHSAWVSARAGLPPPLNPLYKKDPVSNSAWWEAPINI